MRNKASHWLAVAALAIVSGAELGCTTTRYSLQELEAPIVLNGNAFTAAADDFELIPAGTYNGEISYSAASSGYGTTSRAMNSSQINASETLGGRLDKAIRNLRFTVNDFFLFPVMVSCSVNASGDVVQIKRRSGSAQ